MFKADSCCYLPSRVSLPLVSSWFPLLIRTIAKEYYSLSIFHSGLYSLQVVHYSVIPMIWEGPFGDGTFDSVFSATLYRFCPIVLFEGLRYQVLRTRLSHFCHQALRSLHQELFANSRPFRVALRTPSLLSSNYQNSFVDIHCWLSVLLLTFQAYPWQTMP